MKRLHKISHINKKCRILSDERIRLTGVNTKEHYPEALRPVTAEVEIKGKMVVMTFITNNFEWSAFTICQLYQCRWGVEVFFKEIKQTLQPADFLGYNENAMRWQVWAALLTSLPLRFVGWYNRWKHPSVQQALHACAGSAVELLPAEQRHRKLQHHQGTKEKSHPGQP